MASKLVNNLGKLGVRVAAATSDPGRHEKAMGGLIARCADVVPEGTTSLTLAEAQQAVGQQIELEIARVRRGDNEHVRKLVGVDAQRQARNQAATEVYGSMLRTRRAFDAVFGPGSSKQLLGLDVRDVTEIRVVAEHDEYPLEEYEASARFKDAAAASYHEGGVGNLYRGNPPPTRR